MIGKALSSTMVLWWKLGQPLRQRGLETAATLRLTQKSGKVLYWARYVDGTTQHADSVIKLNSTAVLVHYATSLRGRVSLITL